MSKGTVTISLEEYEQIIRINRAIRDMKSFFSYTSSCMVYVPDSKDDVNAMFFDKINTMQETINNLRSELNIVQPKKKWYQA